MSDALPAGSVVVITGEPTALGQMVSARLRASGSQALSIGPRDSDLRRPREVRDMLRSIRPDAVVHVSSELLPATDGGAAWTPYETVTAGVQLIEACRTFGVRRLVLGEARWTVPPVSGPAPLLTLAGERRPATRNIADAVHQMLEAESALYRQRTTLDVSLLSLHNVYAADPFDGAQAGRLVTDLHAVMSRAGSDGISDLLLACEEPGSRLLPVEDAAAMVCDALGIGGSESGAPVTVRQLAQAVADSAGFAGDISWTGSTGLPTTTASPGAVPSSLRDFVSWCLTEATAVSA